MNRSLPGRDRVGTSRFETFLRRLLSVKGVVAPDIEPRISPSIDLTRPPWELGGDALALGWRGFEAQLTPAAVAAQYAFGQLIPPATIGMVAVVQHVILYGGIASATYVTAGIRDYRSAGAAAHGNVQSVDARLGSLSSATVQPAFGVSQGNNVTVPGVTGAIYFQGAGAADSIIPGPWIVLGGWGGVRTFQVLALNVNNQFQATVRWWERSLEPSEYGIT